MINLMTWLVRRVSATRAGRRWLHWLGSTCGMTPEEKAQRACDVLMKDVSRNHVRYKESIRLAGDMLSCFQGDGVVVTAERIETWRARYKELGGD